MARTGGGERAAALLGLFVSSDRELSVYLRLLNIQTEQVLTFHWNRVQLLARELAKRKEMSGAALHAFLDNHV